jgi:hypothetical protein
MFLKKMLIFYISILLLCLIDLSFEQANLCSNPCYNGTNCVFKAKSRITFVCSNLAIWHKDSSNLTISNDEKVFDLQYFSRSRCSVPDKGSDYRLNLISLNSSDSGIGIYKAKEYENENYFSCFMNLFVYG